MGGVRSRDIVAGPETLRFAQRAEELPLNLRERMAAIVLWDSWDPDVDRWEFEPSDFILSRSEAEAKDLRSDSEEVAHGQRT